jgi:hypothetical protein
MEQLKMIDLRKMAVRMNIYIPSRIKKINLIEKLKSNRKLILRGGSTVKYPEIPVERELLDKGSWLSSININDVMAFYENKFGVFKYLGTLPIDFDILYPEIYNINLNKISAKWIGVIFNTDFATGPGKHWISLFINKDDHTICFFDSNGEQPPKQIRKFIENLKDYGRYTVLINKNIKQFSNGTCGLFSIYFIIERIYGKSCKSLFVSAENNDKTMEKLRCKIFKSSKN